jgi:hypothetical protein
LSGTDFNAIAAPLKSVELQFKKMKVAFEKSYLTSSELSRTLELNKKAIEEQ